MKKPIIFILLFLFLSVAGCGGSLAPLDATVTGPEDSTFTDNPPGGDPVIWKNLDFKVKNAAGVALPNVEIEFVSASSIGTEILSDFNGNPIDPNNPTYYKTKTDDRGLARVSFFITLPACDAAADITVDGSVSASVGVTSKLWKTAITVKKC